MSRMSGSLAARKPLKSPLRNATLPAIGAPAAAVDLVGVSDRLRVVSDVPTPELRKMQISEFTAWLRTQTNRHKRPFQEDTIIGYAEAGRVLDRWMASAEVEEDFTGCDVDVLNRFFASYRNSHTQNGTNTRQRNLHHLFKWLVVRYNHPDPWDSLELVRYGPVKSRPSTLDTEFIRDMLAVTGDGKASSFMDVRDHAIIRMLTEGVRREELAQIQVQDLSADLIANPFARLVPLKGAREFSQGRLVPLMLPSAQALMAYLRVRRAHKQASLPALWLGSRNRGPMTGSGVYQMLERRAEEAGYDPAAVRPHMFRHTFAHDWLAGGGSEGDLMELMGWHDRSMVDVYTEDLKEQRAYAAKRARGDMY